jgi:hypothetical protein
MTHKLLVLSSMVLGVLLSGCSQQVTVLVSSTSTSHAATATSDTEAYKPASPSAAPSAISSAAAVDNVNPIDDGSPLYEGSWKYLPVIPAVSAEMRAVYQLGLENGNDPNAFSILGDCQSLPEEFLGLYDSDPAAVAELTQNLQETVSHFASSFDRYSPTVKDGTTTAALLWAAWNDNEEDVCQYGETPLDCELRVHKPSIVIIHIGTHWETRNARYLTIIVEKILEHGAVPLVATKADNRELDERVNQELADLASEYGLPLWNFWAAVQHLPLDGLYPESTWELSEEGKAIHRLSALEALDAVWRGLQ